MTYCPKYNIRSVPQVKQTRQEYNIMAEHTCYHVLAL